MYTPAAFALDDPQELHRILREHMRAMVVMSDLPEAA